MADSVARINDLLPSSRRQPAVMSGSALGADISDAMDTSDGLIAQLSEEIGITVVPRAGNDIALYTDSGVPLFEGQPGRYRSARQRSMGQPRPGRRLHRRRSGYGAGALMPLNSGNLVGLVKVRDEVAVTYQTSSMSSHGD